jgi:histidinol dehydrogenase
MRIISSQEFKDEILSRVINRGKLDLSSISAPVANIIADVKEQGDEALLKYTEKFDKVRLTTSRLRVTENEIKEAYKNLKEKQVAALNEAAANIAVFHRKQMEKDWSLETSKGLTVGQVIKPLQTVGVYVPGGNASYPSSVLMCVIPAKIVGVEKVVVCSPPQRSTRINPAVLAAADIAGADEVYKIGGAQAVAAMAYGTKTVPKVDKIIGPGNVFVTAAKMQVNTDVAVDIPAGPSEILIIADEDANPSFIASDLIAQAEHDPRALAILLTTSKSLATSVKDEVYRQMPLLSRVKTIKSSIETGGLIVIVDNVEEAVDYANLIAPEHLEIQTKAPSRIVGKIRNAGTVFVGEYSTVAFGDYSSGLNHVLPTGGYAKFFSGLSTRDFVKRINFLQCDRQGYLTLKDTTITLAEMEGFDGHARSVSIRE